MHPRTVAIVVALALVGAIALRFLVGKFGLLPISEEVVLKQAIGIDVTFRSGAALRSVSITDPAEMQELLAALSVREAERFYDPSFNRWNRDPEPTPSIDFHFPRSGFSNPQRNYSLTSYTELGGMAIDRAFYDKLCEILSRRLGQKIDLYSN